MTFWQRLRVWLLPQWRADPLNPYRRNCRYCGQGQSMFGLAAFPRSGWWETMCPIMPRKPECDIVHPDEDLAE